jgi:hypothetical protein
MQEELRFGALENSVEQGMKVAGRADKVMIESGGVRVHSALPGKDSAERRRTQ